MPKDYIDFYDMFDGGGPGQMGDRFAGGGILSMLANEFFTPYGSEDDERKRRLLEMRGLFDALEAETSPGGAGGGTGSGTGVRPQARPAPAPNRMQSINEIPTSGPNPAAAAEVARLQEAQRMMGINEIPTPPPSPVADMPAGQFMDLLRSGGAGINSMPPSEQPSVFDPKQKNHRDFYYPLGHTSGSDAMGTLINRAIIAGYDPSQRKTETPADFIPTYEAEKKLLSLGLNPGPMEFDNIDDLMPPSAGAGGAQPEPVPFGGYDAPGDEYRRGFEQMIKQLGAERVRQMPQDQLMQLLQIYGRGGPMR